MYGAHYTPQTISNITQMVHVQVANYHQRKLNARYAVIYCDATYLSVRRDGVAKEALHVLLGITPEGYKEILDYRLFPSESSENYREMFNDIKTRGVQEVLLFVSDGLKGFRNVCLESFPTAQHQSCWVHISRNISRLIRPKDKPEILTELKKVYQATDRAEAQAALEKFILLVSKRYPKVVDLLRSNPSLFTFYEFPSEIRSSIYTTNMIEGLNKQLKRDTKRKEQFPNEDSLDRFVCMKFLDFNQRFFDRIHKGFGLVTSLLNEYFRIELV